ncbi:hypothetical protein Dimus_004028, partial [Dionaea muscipula]
ESEEVNEGENLEENVEWETQSMEEIISKNVNVEQQAQVQGEMKEKEAEVADSGSRETFYDTVEKDRITNKGVSTPTAPPVKKQKVWSIFTGVEPSGSLPDFELIHLQAEFARALQANSRFKELLHTIKPNRPASQKP